MHLVTLTDHDSIDGAERLRSKADFFVSEEVTVRMPSGTELHLGVYDLAERQHIEIQRRRNDLDSLLSYLSEQRLLFSVNHAFSSLTGARVREDFIWFARHSPAFETRNGHQLSAGNRLAARLARKLNRVGLGGSDAHTLVSLGSAYTTVEGARNKADFLEGLRRGMGRARGGSGSYWKLTRDALLVANCLMSEWPCAPLFTPFLLFLPLFTLAHYWNELAFARRWREVAHDAGRPTYSRARNAGNASRSAGSARPAAQLG